jgi:hypothetical protein
MSFHLWIVALSRTTYFLALSSKTTSWSKEYQFSSAYDIGSFNAANLSTIAAAIRSGGGAQTTYEKDYAVSAPSPIRPSNLSFYFIRARRLISLRQATAIVSVVRLHLYRITMCASKVRRRNSF